MPDLYLLTEQDRQVIDNFLAANTGANSAYRREGRTRTAVHRPSYYVKITADNGDGTYNAVEQIWDASANDWTDKNNGRTFDSNSDTEPPIQEENNVQGLPNGGEVVVQVQKHVDDEGGKHWIFPGGGGLPDGDTDNQILYWNATDSEWKKVDAPTVDTDQVLVHRGSDNTLVWINLSDFTCP